MGDRKEPFRILFDLGGVITRDADLFREISIASKRKPEKSEFRKPEDWLNIRSAGNENYFDTIQRKFFDMCEIYDGAPRVVSRSGLSIRNSPRSGGKTSSSLAKWFLIPSSRRLIVRLSLFCFSDRSSIWSGDQSERTLFKEFRASWSDTESPTSLTLLSLIY